MNKPVLLDLFCGAGGASMGYHRAGFEVIGVDIDPQPHYPFEFMQADALDVMLSLVVFTRTTNLTVYDAIHASPPCQKYSNLAKLRPDKSYPDYVGVTRRNLKTIGLPYVIENVVGAPLHKPVGLCGSMFGLGVKEKGLYLQRHRLFECSFDLQPPGACVHRGKAISVSGHTDTTRHSWNPKTMQLHGGYQGTSDERREAMGIDWMTTDEIAEAIPPAYTQYIGRVLKSKLRQRELV